jgi:hypothetical protein
MEGAWAGYRITISIQREHADRKPGAAPRRLSPPQLAPHRLRAEKGLLLASGSRHLGPTR